MVLITNASMFHRDARPARPGNPRPKQRRNLGQARSRHRRVLPPHRAHADSVPPNPRQHHRRRPRPAAGHPSPLHARPRRPAAASRELEAFCDRLNEIAGRRRQAQAGADLHGRPPPGRKLRHPTHERRSRQPLRTGAAAHQSKNHRLLRHNRLLSRRTKNAISPAALPDRARADTPVAQSPNRRC